MRAAKIKERKTVSGGDDGDRDVQHEEELPKLKKPLAVKAVKTVKAATPRKKKAVSAALQNSPTKGRRRTKKQLAVEADSQLAPIDASSDSGTTDNFDFDSDSVDSNDGPAVSKGRKKKAVIAGMRAPATNVKGKRNKVSDPLMTISSDEKEFAVLPDRAELNALQSEGTTDGSSDVVSETDEATDEEKSLAYAAAAEGSLEMRNVDVTPAASTGSGSVSSILSNGSADSIASISPAKRRRKPAPISPTDTPPSPEKKVKKSSRASGQGKRAVKGKQKG